MQETFLRDTVWSLGWEDPLGEEMATHSSLLAWEIPWTEGPGWLPSTGLQWVRHNWSILAHTHIVYIRVCSLCCIFYRFDKCIMSPIHCYSRIGLPPGKSSPSFSPPSGNHWYSYVSRVLPFPECHRVGIISLLDSMSPFQTGFFHWQTSIWVSSMSSCGLTAHFF